MATLILQNSALALVMRYTRVSGKQANKYIPTTAVVMAEIFKVAVALAMQFKVRLQYRAYVEASSLLIQNTRKSAVQLVFSMAKKSSTQIASRLLHNVDNSLLQRPYNATRR